MTYERRLPNDFIIRQMGVEHAEQLAALQKIVFPTLDPAEHYKAEHYRFHATELFPQGQFVALTADGETVAGASSSIRYDLDFDHPHHTFTQLIEGGWMTSHQPEGAWLYGMDMSVHPDYRRLGLARAMYEARHEMLREMGLKGQIAGAMLSGYGAVQHEISAEQYFEEVRTGQRLDPTVSAQMRVGFRAAALIPGYINATICAGYGVLIVLEAERDVL